MKYKVLIKNNLKIGRFSSKDGFIEVTEPNEKELKVIEAFKKQNAIEEVKVQKKSSTRKKSAE